MLFGYASTINQVFLPLSTPHKASYVTFGRKKAPPGNIPEGRLAGSDNPGLCQLWQLGVIAVNGTERCPVFGKIRCPIFCTLKDSNPGCYPEAALPSSSFTATLSIPALRLVLSR